MRNRTVFVILLAVAMLAASCGDDDSSETTTDDTSTTSTTSTTEVAPTEAPEGDETGSTTSTTAPLELTASWPGVTEDTIRLGFLELDFETLVEMGLVENNRGNPEHVIAILVEELNDRGGILGRQVDVYYENVLPLDPTVAEAACLRLVEDNDVFAVLGSFAGPTNEVNPCITDTGETIMIGGTPTPDDLARAKAPWLSTGMNASRALPTEVQLMHDAGLIVDPVAVAYASYHEDDGAGVVVPELERLGYTVVEAVQNSDTDDRQALEAEWSTFAERFRSDGVNTAIMVQSATAVNGPPRLITNGFEGEILVMAPGVLTNLGVTAQIPIEELEGITGTMGATSDESFELPATQACIDIVEAADPEITVVPDAEVPEGERAWATPVVEHCQSLRLFETIATAAGADLTPETFLAAAEGLGEIELPGILFASLGPGKLDANDTMRLATFDPTIGENGGATPAGELVRVEG